MPTTVRKTFTVKEIAEILGISVPGAYALAATEGFPAIRIGERRIVIPRDAFEKWMLEAAHQIKSEV